MNKVIYAFADLMSQPIAFVILTIAGVAGSAIALLTAETIDPGMVVNLAISNLTMIIGQAVLVSGRRDGLAYHLKMDQMLEALPRDNEAIGVEHQDEETIQEKIDETERRAKGSGDGTAL